MKITIERADNGYILFLHSENQTKRVVYDDDEKEEIKKLLYEVAEYFGEPYDKWGDANLNISFDRRGHKL